MKIKDASKGQKPKKKSGPVPIDTSHVKKHLSDEVYEMLAAAPVGERTSKRKRAA